MSGILVTGIGGVVGQGILKNIRNEYDDLHLVGTNVVPVSGGNFLCNQVYQVPYGDHSDYLRQVLMIIEKEEVDLIIPSTDLESYVLGENQSLIPIPVATSASEVTKICLDKYHTHNAFLAYSIPFAPSCLPSEYQGQWDSVIVKPRQGRGSRGIHINPADMHEFDDTYLVQKLFEGDEITTACYITQRREVHSMITLSRELDSGNTSKAEVTFDYDDKLKPIVETMVSNFEFRGSINIQSIVSPEGIVPFEINCRISGTNSIRSHFGFKDVKWTLQEWLLQEAIDRPVITSGCAIRVINDLIYPGKRLMEVSNTDDEFLLK